MIGNQSLLPLIDLEATPFIMSISWESVTSPFDRLSGLSVRELAELGISHLSL